MNTYETYAILDNEIKTLTAKKDALKEQIIEEMVEKEQDKIETGVGSFTVSKLKTWTYSDKVIEMGEKFKAAKAKEESTGDATYVEKPSLRYTSIKI